VPSPAPSKRVSGQITAEEYSALVSCYRLHPGQHRRVALLTGLNYRTCRKAWEQGLPYHGDGVALSKAVSAAMQGEAALQGVAQWAGAAQPGAPGEQPPTPWQPAEGLSADQARAIIAKLASVRAAELALLDETRLNAHATQSALGESREELVAIGRRIKATLRRIADGKPAPEGDTFDLKEALGALKTFVLLGKFATQTVKVALEAERIVLSDLTSYIEGLAPKPGEGGAGGNGGNGDQGGDDETSDEELMAELERDAAAGGSARHLARIRGRAAGLEVIEGGAGQKADETPPAGPEPADDEQEPGDPAAEDDPPTP
jgi:hypothetical protein